MTDETKHPGHCDNPNCDRRHDIEQAIAEVACKASRQIAIVMGGGPTESIYGLAAALVSSAYSTALPGFEKEAVDHMQEIVAEFAAQIMACPQARAAKQKQDAELAAQEPPASPRSSHLH